MFKLLLRIRDLLLGQSHSFECLEKKIACLEAKVDELIRLATDEPPPEPVTSITVEHEPPG